MMGPVVLSRVGVCVGDAVALRVGLLGALGVEVALGDRRVGVRLRVAVDVAVGTGDDVGVSRGDVVVGVVVIVGREVVVGDGLLGTVALWVGVRVRNNVGVKLGTTGVGLDVGVVDGRAAVAVRLAVALDVGGGVKVGVGLRSPMRTTICRGAPMFPAVSRKRTVTSVSPKGNAHDLATVAQNCTWLFATANFGCPNASTVQAPVPARAKLHPKSFNAAVTADPGRKSGGTTAGTPPEHTSGLPSPSARSTRICRSGRVSLGPPFG